MIPRVLPALLAALLLAGCVSHEHTGPFMHQIDVGAQSVDAPEKDRCESYASAKTTYTQCQQFKTAAVEYLRHLSTGDTVCMENTFGEEMTDACKARGVIVDGDPRGFLIEFRDPSTASKWKDYQQKRVYFENGALIDIYLRERGYE